MKGIYAAICLALLAAGCGQTRKNNERAIAVFVPGLTAGSPVYEMLATGVQEAVAQYNEGLAEGASSASAAIIEAGTNQASWGGKLTAVAASGDYALIISSNPSIPDLAAPLTAQFPEQKFVLLDGFLEGNPSIATLRYNQHEQSYMAGAAAGLITLAQGSMSGANAQKKIALITAQEYPVMNEVILPGFTEGAHAVDPDITVEFRVVGSWTDATRAAEIARSLYESGVDVILPIAGGASQGVVQAAEENGFYLIWFDEDGRERSPRFVAASAVLQQKQAAREAAAAFLTGNTDFGSAQTVGMAEGYVDFIASDILPPAIRQRLEALASDIREHRLILEQGQ